MEHRRIPKEGGLEREADLGVAPSDSSGSSSTGWPSVLDEGTEDYVAIRHHDLPPRSRFDWSATQRPDTLEICLNVGGTAAVETRGVRLRFRPGTVGYYRIDSPVGSGNAAWREAGESHRFTTLTYSLPFLRQFLAPHVDSLNPGIRSTVFDAAPDGDAHARSAIGPPETVLLDARPMRESDHDFVRSLSARPASEVGADLFHRAKALEFLASLFFTAEEEESRFFCIRHKRLSAERVDRVRALLQARIDEPPTLKQLGRLTGCSPFYLSRLFSEATGMTISQYLRKLRVEKAAELLASGRFNVSEAAVEVGYRSLSHFSKAFRAVKGCAPSDFHA